MERRKIDDNELALRLIISILAVKLGYSTDCLMNKDTEFYLYGGFLTMGKETKKPNRGDVAIGLTGGYMGCNEFTVGLVDKVIEGGLRIKDFKTEKLCDYTNEQFLIIPREKMGYRFMFGKERKLYDALFKEWCKDSPAFKFYNFSFEYNHFRWSIRKYFENEEYVIVEFDTTDDMKIDEIVKKAFKILDIKLKEKYNELNSKDDFK